MPHATINGARLWYDVSGREDGEPLLLHHGYTASRVNWAPVAERLADEFRIVMMECRGTGESEDTADGYTLEQYAADVVGLLDHLGIERITYAGHSMGGGIGYVLALEHAARLERLVLMAAIPASGIPELPPQAYLDARLAAKRSGDRTSFLAEYRQGAWRPEDEEPWFESRVDHLLRVSEGHLLGGLEAMHALDVAERLGEITLPTLVLAGAADGLLHANLADWQRLPNAGLHVFSRAGHEVAVHEPDGVAEAIRQFMRHGPVTEAILRARGATRPRR